VQRGDTVIFRHGGIGGIGSCNLFAVGEDVGVEQWMSVKHVGWKFVAVIAWLMGQILEKSHV
jgi:hypothetical protein